MWLTNGMHLVDRMMWLVNAPVRSVKAVIATRAHKQRADDVATAFLPFDRSVAAAIFAYGFQRQRR